MKNGANKEESVGLWQKCIDSKGRTFYYSKELKKSVWKLPAAETWIERHDKTGRKFYYCKELKKSVWKIPNCVDREPSKSPGKLKKRTSADGKRVTQSVQPKPHVLEQPIMNMASNSPAKSKGEQISPMRRKLLSSQPNIPSPLKKVQIIERPESPIQKVQQMTEAEEHEKEIQKRREQYLKHQQEEQQKQQQKQTIRSQIQHRQANDQMSNSSLVSSSIGSNNQMTNIPQRKGLEQVQTHQQSSVGSTSYGASTPTEVSNISTTAATQGDISHSNIKNSIPKRDSLLREDMKDSPISAFSKELDNMKANLPVNTNEKMANTQYKAFQEGQKAGAALVANRALKSLLVHRAVYARQTALVASKARTLVTDSKRKLEEMEIQVEESERRAIEAEQKAEEAIQQQQQVQQQQQQQVQQQQQYPTPPQQQPLSPPPLVQQASFSQRRPKRRGRLQSFLPDQNDMAKLKEIQFDKEPTLDWSNELEAIIEFVPVSKLGSIMEGWNCEKVKYFAEMWPATKCSEVFNSWNASQLQTLPFTVLAKCLEEWSVDKAADLLQFFETEETCKIFKHMFLEENRWSELDVAMLLERMTYPIISAVLEEWSVDEAARVAVYWEPGFRNAVMHLWDYDRIDKMQEILQTLEETVQAPFDLDLEQFDLESDSGSVASSEFLFDAPRKPVFTASGVKLPPGAIKLM